METRVRKNTPDGWKTVKLKELTKKIGSGVTPRGGSEVYQKSGVIFLRSQNIQNGYLSLEDVEYISDEIDANMDNSRVSKNDVLYNITGASIGRSSMFSLDKRANVNQHVCIVRLKKDSPKFVNYFLLSWSGLKELDGFQAGGNRQGLNYNQLGSFKLGLPPLPEQNRIVKVLETWDRAIEGLAKKIGHKKEIKKGLMQNLLTGKIRLSGFSDKWKKIKLGSASEINPKIEILPDTFVYIDLESVEKGTLLKENKISLLGAPSRAQRLLSSDDILFQMVRPYQKNNLFFERKGDYVASTGYAQIRAKGSARYLYYLLHTDNFVNNVLERCTGSNYPAINSSDLSKIEIEIPKSNEEQDQIANVLTVADKEIAELERKLALLKAQKTYLLNNLITGIIRTPENM